MAKKTLQIEDVFSESVDVFKKYWVTLTLAAIVVTVGSIFIITAPPLVFGYFILCSKAVKGKTINTLEVLDGFKYFLRSWGVTLGVAILITIGFILLVIPGIALSILLIYVIPLAIIKDLHAIDAIKASYNLGKENIGFTIVLALIVYSLNAVGSFVLLGFIVTVPITSLFLTVAASKL